MKTHARRPRSISQIALAMLLAGCLAGAAPTAPASAGATRPPNTVVLDGATLETIASALANGTATATQKAALEQLRTLADKDAQFGKKQVMGGPGAPAPEYYSQAPYWWPCTTPGVPTPPHSLPACTPGPTSSTCPNGYPYWQWDGHRNPEIKQYPDHQHQVDTWRAVSELSLAWFYASQLRAGSNGSHTSADAYAKRAVLLLRGWFIEPGAQSPDFTFAQSIPCRPDLIGRGEGILDATASLTQLLDALALLDSGAPGNGWTAKDSTAMRMWLTKFRTWMNTSPQGKNESSKTNNHGTWKALGDAALAVYLVDASAAQKIAAGKARQLLGLQIRPDGRQPMELKRTKPWHYSNYNATALCRLAELAAHIPGLPVDLWHYSVPGSVHATLPKAIDFLIPAAEYGDTHWMPHGSAEPKIDNIRYLAYYELRAAAAQASDAAAKTAVNHVPPPALQTPPPANFQTPLPSVSPPPPYERGNIWEVVPDCEVLNGSVG